MRYQVTVRLTAERLIGSGRILYDGPDWDKAKEQFNFWSNEYREAMDSIAIRVRR